MLELAKRALEKQESEGTWRLLTSIPPLAYEKMWPHLPRADRRLTMNGVTIPIRRRWSDQILSNYLCQNVPTDNPEYEENYISMIREFVTEGDTVRLVGGGWGVSTVVAANEAGMSGSVTTYEAHEEAVRQIRKTVELNDVDETSEIIHASIGSPLSVGDTDFIQFDQTSPSRSIAPSDLPPCDILGLDCEGAELQILRELPIRPDYIIVEHHQIEREKGKISSSDGKNIIMKYQPEHVESVLIDLGYKITFEKTDPWISYFAAEYEK